MLHLVEWAIISIKIKVSENKKQIIVSSGVDFHAEVNRG